MLAPETGEARVEGWLFLLWIGSCLVGLWAVVDALHQPASAWIEIGKDRAIWVLLTFMLGMFGAVFYFAWLRPQLVAAERYRLASIGDPQV